LSGIQVSLDEHSSSFELEINILNFKEIIKKANEIYTKIDHYLKIVIEKNKALLKFSKWGLHLPIEYKCKIIKERYFDFESAIYLINNMNLVEAS